MSLPSIIFFLWEAFAYVMLNSKEIMIIVPNVIKVYGIIGLIWHGYYLTQDQRWLFRLKRIFSSCVAVVVGIVIEFFILEFYFIQ